MTTTQQNFETFISGYSETQQHHVPSDITQLFTNYIIAKLCIKTNIINRERLNRISHNCMEIYVDELTAKVATPSYYQIKAIYELNDEQIERFKAIREYTRNSIPNFISNVKFNQSR